MILKNNFWCKHLRCTSLPFENQHVILYFRSLLKKTGPLKINVKGIDCMTSNYKKVNVVYAKAKIVGETDEYNLQKITDELSQHFYERGGL